MAGEQLNFVPQSQAEALSRPELTPDEKIHQARKEIEDWLTDAKVDPLLMKTRREAFKETFEVWDRNLRRVRTREDQNEREALWQSQMQRAENDTPYREATGEFYDLNIGLQGALAAKYGDPRWQAFVHNQTLTEIREQVIPSESQQSKTPGSSQQ